MSKQESKYEIMEARDEAQIIAVAKGSIIKEMFYSFYIGGKKVTGISWVGTKEIARRYGGLEMGLPIMTDIGEEWAASVQCTDLVNKLTLVGTSTVSKTIVKKNGDIDPNKFAYTQASSKAQRNAIRALIPERVLIEMLETFIAEKKGKNTPPTARQTESNTRELNVDPDEEKVKATMIANDLDIDHCAIYTYLGKLIVKPSKDFPGERFNEYNKTLGKLLKAEWNAEEERWEVPI